MIRFCLETFRTFNIRYPHKGIVIICFNGPRNDETLFPKIVPCRANGDVFATKAKCLKHGLLHGKMCCCNKNCLMYARLVELFALKTRAFSRRSVNWQKSAQSEKRIERPHSGGKSASIFRAPPLLAELPGEATEMVFPQPCYLVCGNLYK